MELGDIYWKTVKHVPHYNLISTVELICIKIAIS